MINLSNLVLGYVRQGFRLLIGVHERKQ